MKTTVSVIILLLFGFPAYPAEKLNELPETWELKQNTSQADCINLTGQYRFRGEGAPHYPSDYRGFPFSIDTILVRDLSLKGREEVTQVKINQASAEEFALFFYDESGNIIAKRNISKSENESVACKPE